MKKTIRISRASSVSSASNVAIEMQHIGQILSMYSKFFDAIMRLSKNLRETGNDLFKDIIPSRAEQASIFRQMTSCGFKKLTAVEFLAWLSLAKALNDPNSEIKGASVMEVFRSMIKCSDKVEDDMANILYLFGSNAEAFYHHLKFEMEKGPIGQEMQNITSEVDLIEMMQLTSLVSQYQALFFWEKRNKKKHPEHDELLKTLLAE